MTSRRTLLPSRGIGSLLATLAELHLEAYLPADETTARILRDRRRRADAETRDLFPPEFVVGT